MASVVAEERDLLQLRSDLINLSRSGLDDSLPSVRKWMETLYDDQLFKRPADIVAEVIGGGKSLESAKAELGILSLRLGEGLGALNDEPDLRSAPDIYANRLDELRKLRLLRSLTERASNRTGP